MNAPAAIALRRQGAPDLLIGYADAVAAMPVNPMHAASGATPPLACLRCIRI